MKSIKIHYYSKYKHTILILICIFFLALLMGYVNSVIKYFINFILTPYKFNYILKSAKSILWIEKLKDMAFIIITILIINFLKGRLIQKFANFIFIISLFNISTYISLMILKKSFSIILTKDIIFYLPFPFFGSIAMCIIISFTGLLCSLIIHCINELKGNFSIDRFNFLFILSALILFILSFITNQNNSSFKYNWIFLITGLLFIILSIINSLRINLFDKKKKIKNILNNYNKNHHILKETQI